MDEDGFLGAGVGREEWRASDMVPHLSGQENEDNALKWHSLTLSQVVQSNKRG